LPGGDSGFLVFLAHGLSPQQALHQAAFANRSVEIIER
jgi:hypothetical protein